jgi:hypothetical protein
MQMILIFVRMTAANESVIAGLTQSSQLTAGASFNSENWGQNFQD